jgi:sigma-E factor negative regulatory protein RseA
MSDSLRESISALVDDEAQELELHRVLSNMEKDEQLRATWKRFQVASFSMKRQMDCRYDLDISGRVSAALADEPSIDIESSIEKSRFGGILKPLLSTAVAASAAFLVVFAVQMGGQDEAGVPVAAGDQPLITNLVAGTNGIDDVNGANGHIIAVSPEVMTPVEKRIQSLIENHAQQASMSQNRGVMPYTQLVESQELQGY